LVLEIPWIAMYVYVLYRGRFVRFAGSEGGLLRFSHIYRRAVVDGGRHDTAARPQIKKGEGDAGESHHHEDHPDELNVNATDAEVRGERQDGADGDECESRSKTHDVSSQIGVLVP
jgi:hypothetical protein